MTILENSKILIGKEPGGSHLQLAVIKNNKQVYSNLNNTADVPQCVSRLNLQGGIGHCEIIVEPGGAMRIRNLKPQNRTYVDGMEVQEKIIHTGNYIQLGMDQYPLDLSSVLVQAEHLAQKIIASAPQVNSPNVNTGGYNVNASAGYSGTTGGMMPPPPAGNGGGAKTKQSVNIRNLQYIWDRYESEKLEIAKHRKNLGLMASVSPVFTITGGLLMTLSMQMEWNTEVKWLCMGFTFLALVIMLISLVRRAKDDSELRTKELTDRFQHEYSCPRCGKFMGYQSYYLVQQMGACPKCHSNFIY